MKLLLACSYGKMFISIQNLKLKIENFKFNSSKNFLFEEFFGSKETNDKIKTETHNLHLSQMLIVKNPFVFKAELKISYQYF